MSSMADSIILQPTFAGEIMVARRNAMTIHNTKIDDLTLGIYNNLPKHSKEEKIAHYNYKLKLVWEGRLCLE
jgi:hypothetical protein